MTVVRDPEPLDGPDLKHSSAESRFLRLGQSAGGAVLMVAYTFRRSGDAEATGVNDQLFSGASMKPPADMSKIEFHPTTAVTLRLKTSDCAEIGSRTCGFLDRVIGRSRAF